MIYSYVELPDNSGSNAVILGIGDYTEFSIQIQVHVYSLMVSEKTDKKGFGSLGLLGIFTILTETNP